MRARCLTLLVAACMLATGCGDDAATKADTSTSAAAPPGTTTSALPDTTTTVPQTSSNGPDARVRSYFVALAGREGEKACSMLTKAAQREAISLVEALEKRTFKSCGAALVAVVPAAEKRVVRAQDVKITKSQVDGDRAAVRVERGTSDIELTRLGGRWFIAGGFR